MHRVPLIGTFLALTLLSAAAPDYPRDVALWQEVSVSPNSDQAARMTWSYAANFSRHEWRVYAERNQIHAQLISANSPRQGERPKFTPKAGRFEDASEFARIDDGWLVGFNEGEFGAALYWFNTAGDRNYKLSDHQVVRFFSYQTASMRSKVWLTWAPPVAPSSAFQDQIRALAGRSPPSRNFPLLPTPSPCAAMAQYSSHSPTHSSPSMMAGSPPFYPTRHGAVAFIQIPLSSPPTSESSTLECASLSVNSTPQLKSSDFLSRPTPSLTNFRRKTSSKYANNMVINQPLLNVLKNRP